MKWLKTFGNFFSSAISKSDFSLPAAICYSGQYRNCWLVYLLQLYYSSTLIIPMDGPMPMTFLVNLATASEQQLKLYFNKTDQSLYIQEKQSSR